MPRVLLVEDSPTNQLLAQGLLEEAGYEVTIVANGEGRPAVIEVMTKQEENVPNA